VTMLCRSARFPSRSGALAAALWFVLDGCAGPRIAHVGPVTGIATADGATVVSCSQGCVEIRTGDDVRLLRVPDGRAVAVALLGVDRFVVGGGTPSRCGWLRVLTRAGSWDEQVTVDGDVFSAVAAFSDGCIAGAAADGAVWLWSPGGAPRCVATHGGAARAVAFLPDGTLLSAGRDGRILTIDTRAGRTRELLDHTAAVECLAVARDGTFASGARDGRVRVHDGEGRLLRTWQRLGGSVLALLEHEDGWLCGMDDGRLLLLRPGYEGALLLADRGPPIHALARSGNQLLCGTQAGVDHQAWPVGGR